MGQQGGWPLTMFLTPEGEPFWGGTYFPPEPRYGRPGFPQVLEQVAGLWRERAATRSPSNRDQLWQALSGSPRPRAGERPDAGLRRARRPRASPSTSTRSTAGIGGAPKFPQAPMLELIWRTRPAAPATARCAQRTLHTLARIGQGGIYDHLGGGFARYSVDAYWLVPHFEKMLYDNAQLARPAERAWRGHGRAAVRASARAGDGGVARARDAGGRRLRRLARRRQRGRGGQVLRLGRGRDRRRCWEPTPPAFRLAYGVTASGNWEGKTILNRLHEPGLPGRPRPTRSPLPADPARGARAPRPPGPRRQGAGRLERPDDRALAEASGLLDRADWLDRAASAFAAVQRTGRPDDRLAHSALGGRLLETGVRRRLRADGRAALALFGQTGDRQYLEQARAWVARADADYLDPERGAYHQTTADAGLILRLLSAQDGPYPSGNGTMALVAAELWYLTGDDAYRRRAEPSSPPSPARPAATCSPTRRCWRRRPSSSTRTSS